MNELMRLAVPCDGETWILEGVSRVVVETLKSGVRRAVAAGRLRGYLETVCMEAKEREDGSLLVNFPQARAGLDYLEAIRREA